MNCARHSQVRVIVFLAALALVFATLVATAVGHQPKTPEAERVTRIENPEVSKAYYGELVGEPQRYKLQSKKPFVLYLNILAPAIRGAKKDFTVTLTQETQSDALFQIDGQDSRWGRFYEPFAGDMYWQGPELKKKMLAGTYFIDVSRPADRGRYVLAVGEKEVFPINEMIGMVRSIYEQKTQFFEKSPLSIFQGIIGGSMLGVLLIIIGLSAWAYRLRTRKRRANSR